MGSVDTQSMRALFRVQAVNSLRCLELTDSPSTAEDKIRGLLFHLWLHTRGRWFWYIRYGGSVSQAMPRKREKRHKDVGRYNFKISNVIGSRSCLNCAHNEQLEASRTRVRQKSHRPELVKSNSRLWGHGRFGGEWHITSSKAAFVPRSDRTSWTSGRFQFQSESRIDDPIFREVLAVVNAADAACSHDEGSSREGYTWRYWNVVTELRQDFDFDCRMDQLLHSPSLTRFGRGCWPSQRCPFATWPLRIDRRAPQFDSWNPVIWVTLEQMSTWLVGLYSSFSQLIPVAQLTWMSFHHRPSLLAIKHIVPTLSCHLAVFFMTLVRLSVLTILFNDAPY